MNIPDTLQEGVRNGNVVLFLGSGASLGASDATGKLAPRTDQLASTISDRFLGGRYRTASLSQVSELAINQHDQRTVQDCIHDMLVSLTPTPAHLLIPSFRWWGIATTNYDLLVERAFAAHATPLQSAVPFIENGDRVQDKMRDPSKVMLLKLHGCITRTSNTECPLILTVDQYVQYRKSRDRIFDHLFDWAYEKPILFIGHSLQDPDLRAVLLELHALCKSRPRYYAVTPDVEDLHEQLWSERRITCLKGTFGEFMHSLDGMVPSAFRILSLQTTATHPITSRLSTLKALSERTMQFLAQSVSYVASATSSRSVSPKDFYRGLNPEWSAIEQGLDVPRALHQALLSEHFTNTSDGVSRQPDFVLLKAHAGAGKSVLMRRLAWDAAHNMDKLCLYLKDDQTIDTDAVAEILESTSERLYLFVDNVADHVDDVLRLLEHVGRRGGMLTIMAAERANEWTRCTRLFGSVTEEHEVKYLNSREITDLLALLDKHRSLGALTNADQEARVKAFAERAGRQLLVALHEATFGEPFEKIVEDEYNAIQPEQARLIYLTICVLNRFNVPVRAGTVSRLHGVSFSRFSAEFFEPLEGVVFTRFDPGIKDNVYQARHPHVAEMVFERVLSNPRERFDVYMRCLDALNVDYDSDFAAFAEMIRGRHVLSLFADHIDAKAVYNKAREKVGDTAFLLQQQAIYELHRPNGNTATAIEYLGIALATDPRNGAIRHSLAEAYLSRADTVTTAQERDACLEEAKRHAWELRRARDGTSHAFHTLAKINLRRMADYLHGASDCLDPAFFEQLVKDSERGIREGLQRYPEDSYLLHAEAQLAKVLRDSTRAKVALERAFAANPRSPYLAQRLASVYRDEGSVDKAKDTLATALESNRSEKALHYSYGRLLAENSLGSREEALYHLQRSFSEGDQNYEARILYGRQLFLLDRCREAKDFFARQKDTKCPPYVRRQPVYPLEGKSCGVVARRDYFHCMIARQGDNEWIHAQSRNIDAAVWEQLKEGVSVTCQIAFTLLGPTAINVAKV